MDVFAALADPARREVLTALGVRELSAGEIAALFPVSRPAVSRHLRVLREAGLVRDELVGRRRVYRLEVSGLEPVTAWLGTVAGPDEPRTPGSVRWSERLDALDTEVRRTRRERRTTAAPRPREETA